MLLLQGQSVSSCRSKLYRDIYFCLNVPISQKPVLTTEADEFIYESGFELFSAFFGHK